MGPIGAALPGKRRLPRRVFYNQSQALSAWTVQERYEVGTIGVGTLRDLANGFYTASGLS